MGKKNKIKKALITAVSVLLEQKPYEKITVKDLVLEADVARSSFYAHYRDKDDLVLSGFEEIGIVSNNDIFTMDANGNPDFASMLFKGSEDWKAVSKVFLSLDQATVPSHYVRNMIIVQMRSWLVNNTKAPRDKVDIEIKVHYLASALLGLLTWWVNSDFPCTSAVISEKFNRLALQGLGDF